MTVSRAICRWGLAAAALFGLAHVGMAQEPESVFLGSMGCRLAQLRAHSEVLPQIYPARWVNPLVSPDGRLLAFNGEIAGPAGGTLCVALLDLDSGQLTTALVPEIRDGAVVACEWSADGTQLLCLVHKAGLSQLVRWQPGLEQARGLLEDPRGLAIVRAGFLPAGEVVWFADAGSGRVYLLGPNDKQPTPVGRVRGHPVARLPSRGAGSGERFLLKPSPQLGCELLVQPVDGAVTPLLLADSPARCASAQAAPGQDKVLVLWRERAPIPQAHLRVYSWDLAFSTVIPTPDDRVVDIAWLEPDRALVAWGGEALWRLELAASPTGVSARDWQRVAPGRVWRAAEDVEHFLEVAAYDAGKRLIVNSEGALWRVEVATGAYEQLVSSYQSRLAAQAQPSGEGAAPADGRP